MAERLSQPPSFAPRSTTQEEGLSSTSPALSSLDGSQTQSAQPSLHGKSKKKSKKHKDKDKSKEKDRDRERDMKKERRVEDRGLDQRKPCDITTSDRSPGADWFLRIIYDVKGYEVRKYLSSERTNICPT